MSLRLLSLRHVNLGYHGIPTRHWLHHHVVKCLERATSAFHHRSLAVMAWLVTTDPLVTMPISWQSGVLAAVKRFQRLSRNLKDIACLSKGLCAFRTSPMSMPSSSEQQMHRCLLTPRLVFPLLPPLSPTVTRAFLSGSGAPARALSMEQLLRLSCHRSHACLPHLSDPLQRSPVAEVRPASPPCGEPTGVSSSPCSRAILCLGMSYYDCCRARAVPREVRSCLSTPSWDNHTHS